MRCPPFILRADKSNQHRSKQDKIRRGGEKKKKKQKKEKKKKKKRENKWKIIQAHDKSVCMCICENVVLSKAIAPIDKLQTRNWWTIYNWAKHNSWFWSRQFISLLLSLLLLFTLFFFLSSERSMNNIQILLLTSPTLPLIDRFDNQIRFHSVINAVVRAMPRKWWCYIQYVTN